MTTPVAPPLNADNLSHDDADMPPVATTQSSEIGTPATPESNGRPARPAFLNGSRKPRAPRPAPKPKNDKTPRVSKDDATLKKALVELYTSIGMVALPFDAPCATVIVNSADQAAESLVKLANENDGVRRALEGLTQTSAWGGVIAAHAPIIMAVVSHHSPGGRARAKAEKEQADNVTDIADAPRRPETIRSTRAADGFGRFCTECNAALVRGVTHHCEGKRL